MDSSNTNRPVSTKPGQLHNCKEQAELLAGALLAAQLDTFATALQEAEARAATLRSLLLATNGLWLGAPNAARLQLPATARLLALLQEPPANARAVADQAMAGVFREHYAALLSDPDASLAAAGG